MGCFGPAPVYHWRCGVSVKNDRLLDESSANRLASLRFPGSLVRPFALARVAPQGPAAHRCARTTDDEYRLLQQPTARAGLCCWILDHSSTSEWRPRAGHVRCILMRSSAPTGSGHMDEPAGRGPPTPLWTEREMGIVPGLIRF